MIRKLCLAICVMLLFGMFCVNQAHPEAAKPLKPGVLVLPLQAGENVPADQAFLGMAIQNVLENLLATHSELEECWANWHFDKLFPHETDLQRWIRGQNHIPPAVSEIGMRYLVAGRVTLQEGEVRAQLELLDQLTGNKQVKDVTVDLPALGALRRDFLAMLAQVGITVPESQKPKMLWKEDLSFPAFVLLGQGLYEDFSLSGYEKKDPVYNPKPFEDGLQLAPQSYLLLNGLGWVVYRQGRYREAMAYFDQALALNPAGADAADGMIGISKKTGDKALEEQWTEKKAQIQGKDEQVVLASLWNQRGNTEYKQEDYTQASECYGKAIALNPAKAVYLTNLASAYRKMEDFERGQKLLEAALPQFPLPEDRKELRIALAEVHFAWAKNLDKQAAYADAIVQYQAALAIDKEYRRKQAAIDLNNLGYAHAQLRQYQQALAYYEQALTLWREGQDRAGERITLDNTGVTYRLLKQYDDAIASHEQALTLAREVNNRPSEGTTLNNLGLVYDDLGQYDTAMSYYEQALTIRRETQDRQGEMVMLNNLGGSARSLKQYERAATYYEQALALSRESKDRSAEAAALNRLGITYDERGQYDTAARYYEQALHLWQELQDHPSHITALNNLGGVYKATKQPETAAKYYEQALALARAIQNREQEISSLNSLGALYNNLSQYDKAVEYYEHALTVALQLVEQSQTMAVLNKLGGIYRNLGRYDKAKECHEQALAIARQLHDRGSEATSLSGIGAAWYALKEPQQSLSFYEQVLTIARELQDRSHEGIALNGIGAAYYARKRYDESLRYFEQALTLAREQQNRFQEAYALNGVGAAAYFLQQYEKTTVYLEQSLALRRDLQDKSDVGSSFKNLMFAWNARKKSRLAIFYGKLAVNTWQEIRGQLKKESQEFFLKSKEDTYRKLADILIAEGRLPEAQQVLGLLKEEEYFEFVRRDGSEAASLAGRANLTPEEAIWERRYQAIADQVTALGTERGALLAKPDRTREEDERLAQLEADLTVAGQAFQKFLDALATEFGTSQSAGEKVFHLRETQGLMEDLRELGAGVVALYTLVGEEKYRVILVTPDVQVARESLVSAADLNRKVLAFRQVLQNPGLDPRPLARELYEMLLAPVATDLQEANARTLMWSLDGVLRYLPIAALYDGTQYMVERYHNVVFTPASQARLKDQPSPTWKGLGLGVSQAHGTFSALPAVADELHGIIREEGRSDGGGILPGTIKLDTAFTASAMLAALRQRYPVVHIASHFQFRPGNETDSFLLLGDGSHLPLAQIKTLPNVFGGVDLLTLSACDTATGGTGGDGKEIEGFGVLAQRQGAKAVIASLWPVADESTKVLMQTFYRRRETPPGITKVEALRQAQLALLHGNEQTVAAGENSRAALPITNSSSIQTQPRFEANPQAPHAHPYYWAPFILIGNWK